MPPTISPYSFTDLLGSAVGGLAEGEIEGRQLQQKFEHDRMLNQLRAIEMLRSQFEMQQAMQPQYKFSGERMFTTQPGREPVVTELPPTKFGEARIQSMEQQAQTGAERNKLLEERLRQLQEQGPKLPTRSQEEGALLRKYREALETGDPDAITRARNDYFGILKPAAAAQNITGQVREQLRTMGVLDPNTATEDQLKKAQADVDRRMMGRNLGVAAGRAQIQEGVTERKEQRKIDRSIGTMEVALNQMEAVLPALEAKGFLPRNAGVYEIARSRAKQLAGQNDPDWVKWKTNQGALIGIDRSVYNDIGRGGQMMYSAVKEFSEHPPTAEAARGAFGQWREAISVATGKATVESTRGVDFSPGERKALAPKDTMRIRNKTTGKVYEGPRGPIPEGYEAVR